MDKTSVIGLAALQQFMRWYHSIQGVQMYLNLISEKIRSGVELLGLGGNVKADPKNFVITNMRSFKILQLDDDDFVHQMFLRHIDKAQLKFANSYSVLHVKTLEQAYEALRKDSFDLIVSDRSLENGVDAFENIDKIKAISKGAKILGNSFLADKDQIANFLAKGGDAFIPKQELKNQLERLLNNLFPDVIY